MVNLLDLFDLVSVASFAATVYFTYRMAVETRWDKQFAWFFFAAVLLGGFVLLSTENVKGVVKNHLSAESDLLRLRLGQVGPVFGALALAYASPEIMLSMREVRERLS